MEFRTITDAEVEPFLLALSNAFGVAHLDKDEVAADRTLIELDRTFVAVDDGAFVGCAGVFTQQMVVPGGATVPTAGVTMVGVLPTHRRRGILRELMTRMLAQATERGEPVAALFASEAVIYGRFGFAPAAWNLTMRVALDRVVWATAPPPGRVLLRSREDAIGRMCDIYDRAVLQRAGGIVLEPAAIEVFFREPTKEDEKPFYAIHEDADGTPDAFAMYRTKHRWPRGLPHTVLKVKHLVAATPEGGEAIWRFLFDVDLVSKVTAYGRPVDEPLLLQLDEPRALRPELDDGLLVRPVDLAAAWSARGFAADGVVTVAVSDQMLPAVNGSFELRVEDAHGSCRRVDAQPDVSCTVQAAGATYLGGATWAALAAAGRVHEHTPGAIAHLDAMFRVDVAPWPIVFF